MCDELHPKNTHVMTFTTCALFLLLPVLASARPSANALEARARQVTASSKAGMAWPNGNYNSIGQYESNKVSWCVLVHFYTARFNPDPRAGTTLGVHRALTITLSNSCPCYGAQLK
jgi:hypothetical protein